MSVLRSALLRSIIETKLEVVVCHIERLAQHGFDVSVCSSLPEISECLHTILSQNGSVLARKIEVASNYEDAKKILKNQDTNAFVAPLVFIHSPSDSLPVGFVRCPLPDLCDLLPSIPQVINCILEYYSLSVYIDIFDREKLISLKNIALECGFTALVDAVIQTCYLAGFSGDEHQAGLFLRNFNEQIQGSVNKSVVHPHDVSRQFFNYVLDQKTQPHIFLKAALSYFVVQVKGLTSTRASRLLEISRTTLIEHLKLADELEISKLFSGQTSDT